MIRYAPQIAQATAPFHNKRNRYCMWHYHCNVSKATVRVAKQAKQPTRSRASRSAVCGFQIDDAQFGERTIYGYKCMLFLSMK